MKVYRSSERQAQAKRPSATPAPGGSPTPAGVGGKTGLGKLSKRQRKRQRTGTPPSNRGAKPIRTTEDAVAAVVSGATEKRKAAAAKAGAVHRAKHVARKHMPRCGARTKKGTPCRHLAGYNTNHEGTGCCFLHGGASPQHEKHAVVAVANAEVEAMAPVMQAAVPDDLQAADVLRSYMYDSTSRFLYLSEAVGKLDPDELTEQRGIVLERMLGDWADRRGRAAKYLLESGLAGIQANVTAQVDQALAFAVQQALGAAGLGQHTEVVGAALRLEIAKYNASLGAHNDEDITSLEAALAAALAAMEPDVTDADVVTAPVPEADVVPEPEAEEPLVVPEAWAER